MNFLTGYTYFIALSFLVSIIMLNRKSLYYLKIFSPFLLLTLLVEVYASYLSTINKPNIVIYNFFSAFEFSFYLFWISNLFRNLKAKKLALISSVIYGCAAVINILFIQGIRAFHTTSYAAGCLVLVAFCIYYFYELFKYPGAGKLERNPAFWICSGLLFFYCCGFPLWGLMNIWSDKLMYLINNIAMITDILNSFLYSLFTIAYLCNRTRNSTLSSS
jgi:hypothetical protein